MHRPTMCINFLRITFMSKIGREAVTDVILFLKKSVNYSRIFSFAFKK